MNNLPPSMRDVPDRVHTPPGAVLGYLHRERFWSGRDDFPRWSDGRPARPETDVRLEILAAAPLDPDGNALGVKYPACPDCGAEGCFRWFEAGYSPGTRICMGCEGLFADARFSRWADVYAPEGAGD